MINHFIPKDLKDALKILSEHDCYIMAGGTDLMVQKHFSTGLVPKFDKDILYVSNLKELDYIKVDDNGDIHIGAATKYYELETSPLIRDIYHMVIKEIASPNIRNMATLVGNIANASPAGDSLVPLVIDDAKVVLSSIRGNRTVLISDFIYGVRKIDKEKDEMITEVIIPNTNLKYSYRKVGSRKAETITKVSFLGAYKLNKDVIEDFRIAFGSVSIKVVRNKDIEKKYIGKKVSELDENQIVKDYYPLVAPITDQRSSKEYRHKVAMNLLKQFIRNLKGGNNE